MATILPFVAAAVAFLPPETVVGRAPDGPVLARSLLSSHAMKKTMIRVGVVALLAAFGTGCKEDLDAARASLASVTKERDDLSARVVALERELDVTKAELAREKARATTVVAKGPPAVPETRSKEPANAMAAKHGAGPAAGTAPAAPSRQRQKPSS